MSERFRFVILGMLMACAAFGTEVPGAADSFFADQRAKRTGDLLTVIITESASVAQTARTQADKEQSLTGSLLQKDGEVQRWDAEIETQFNGGGRIERTGRLLGKLTVIVEHVDEYGNLHVAGQQMIYVNNERQQMRLEGLVRPRDIGPDNTVVSWRVSDARISLLGRGFLSRKQAPGLIARLLSYFGV